MELNFNKIADAIISNNSVYSMSADTIRDKVIDALLEEPYFKNQFAEAESEEDGVDIGEELGNTAFQLVTFIYKKLGLD